jgi:hypothetical protein
MPACVHLSQQVACNFLVYCIAYSSSMKMEVIYSLQHWLTLTWLHDVLPRKTELLIITEVRNSDPTSNFTFNLGPILL